MISAEAWSGMWSAFAEGWPQEVCMAVYTDETFEVLANIHENPTESFRVSPADLAKLESAYTKGELLAFLHSHPKGSAEPSYQDYLSQMSRERGKGQGWTYGIVPVHAEGTGIITHVGFPGFFGDAVDRGPLEGRPYLYGISDCFTLLRDWHKAQGIYIPDAPRLRRHWEFPAGSWQRRYFSDWIRKCGFKEVERHERQPGDSFTFSQMSEEPDHCGVYLGEARYLHHCVDRNSSIDQFRYENEMLARLNARFWRLENPASC